MMQGNFAGQPEWVMVMDALYARRIPFFFMLDFECREPLVIPLDELEETGIKCSLCDEIIPETQDTIRLDPKPNSLDEYRIGFDKVMSHIRAGDTYLLNYCQSTFIGTDISLGYIYTNSIAPYKLLVPGKFVVFSPEPFISIDDEIIRTFPMKGTIDMSVPNAAELLLNDIKEQEEHATVVDLLRNDLSIVATNVVVDKYRYLTTIHSNNKTLLQCSSAISGRIREEYTDRPGSLLKQILPAGSISGAPKKKTVQIIREVESTPRNFYTGVFGVYDGSEMQSAVMIRFIEQTPDGFYYKSGGGITYRSTVESEYKEMLDKIYVPVS